jgi:hypothetical protein
MVITLKVKGKTMDEQFYHTLILLCGMRESMKWFLDIAELKKDP